MARREGGSDSCYTVRGALEVERRNAVRRREDEMPLANRMNTVAHRMVDREWNAVLSITVLL